MSSVICYVYVSLCLAFVLDAVKVTFLRVHIKTYEHTIFFYFVRSLYGSFCS